MGDLPLPTVASLIEELRSYPPDARVISATVRMRIGKRRSALTISEKATKATNAILAAHPPRGDQP